MKNTALILTFLILAVMGGMMVVFENAYGEYFLLASVFLGLYLQFKEEQREKKLDEPNGEKQEPHR